MLVTEGERGQGASSREMFDRLTFEWARLTHQYARSMHAYQLQLRQRSARLSRPPGVVGQPAVSIASTWRSTAAIDAVPVESVTMPHITPVTRSPLTARQVEIAQLIALGLSNEEIARELVLTPGTVGNHIGHILRRLGARNRAQVAAWVTQQAARDGLATETAS